MNPIAITGASSLKLTTNPSQPKEAKKSDFGAHSEAISKAMEQVVHSQSQARSDLGQKLQFQLNEANSLYSRSTQAQSNIAGTHNKTADALVSNIRG